MKTEAHQENEGTANVFDGYKARLAEVLEKERQRLMKDAEKESAKIIAEARQAAQGITGQAEARAKQEARERLKREVERILASAKEEAAKTVAGARQTAAEESGKILAEARQSAETAARTLLDEATKAADESARTASGLKQKAEQDAVETREKALREAGQTVKDASDAAGTRGTEEEARIIAEAEGKGKSIIDEARTKAQETLDGAVRAAGEAIQKLGGRSAEGAGKAGHGPEQTGPAKPPVEASGTSVSPQDNGELFQGSVELEVAAGADAAGMAAWIAKLREVPGLRVLSIQNTAPGTSNKFLILADAATPLLSILKAMPLVVSAAKQDQKLLVSLADRGPQDTAAR